MKKSLITLISATCILGGISQAGNYTAEQQDAYYYAYSQKITTISSIEKANMNGQLTRVAMAKMISNFAINVLGLQPDTSKDCSFSDVPRSLDFQYNYGVTQACQLGLMGMGSNGKKSDKFNPYGTVTRAQFATAFSRALSQVNGSVVADGNPYYSTHLSYLHSKGIINSVSTPLSSAVEKRGNVMIMMKRASGANENKTVDVKDTTSKKNVSNKTTDYDGILGVEVLDTGISNKLEIKITNKAKSKIQIDGIHLSSVTSDNAIGVYQGDNTMQPEYLDRNTDKTIDVKFWYPADLNQGDSTIIIIMAEVKGGYAILDNISFSINRNAYVFSKDTSKKTEWNKLSVKNDGRDTTKNGTIKTYYDNGQIHEVLNYKNGKLNGEYIEYYYNGKLSKKGQYKDNEKTGKWIEYFENGDVKSEGTYKDGKLEGYAVRYCEKGKESQGYYRDGKCITWEGDYKNGEYGGAIREAMEQYGTFNSYAFWSNEQVQSAAYYDNNGKLNGDYISFYESGQIKERGQYKNNKKEGEWIEYYADGSVASKGSYKNGELDGYWIRYCEKWNDQCTSLDGNYKDGKQVRGVEEYGTFNSYAFWSNEQVQSAAYYDNNGKLNGDYISFYENGQLKEQGQYKDDKKEGEWVEYFQDGSIASKGSYKDNEKEGEWIEYFYDGEVKSKGSYKNGKLDGYWIRYCEKGNDQCTSLDGNYKDGEIIRDD